MNDRVSSPKWRPWRFSLRFLLLIVLVIALVLGFRDSRIRLQLRKELARNVLDAELVRRHFVGRDDLKGKLRLPSSSRADLFQTPLDFEFRTLQIGPNVQGAKSLKTGQLDEFQKDSLRKINSGDYEVWQNSWSGRFRYVTRLKSSPSCTSCHAEQGKKKDFVVSVSF